MEGVMCEGVILIFLEVYIDGNGWFVMYLFEDGKFNGNIYVGYMFV